ncbi:MAG: hypothetical protein IAF94_09570 [Pirellulaceae bacterium]|nr:hypothetical protein [Pirellulaceae bacterium]
MPTTTSPPPKDAPSALDVSGDFRNLRTHGATSLGELKEFLEKLRRKSPQEVIGIVSSSLLIQSVIIATAITFVFMVAFTVGPFLLMEPVKPKPAQTPAASVAPPTTATAAKATATKGEKAAGPSEEDAAKAVKAMGMDEAKAADPTTNPLEKDFDKLLDGAK